MVSLSHGNDQITEVAIRYGADIHSGDEYALRMASHLGNRSLVKLLLELGADVHARDDEALKRASKKNYASVVELLIDFGADKNRLHPVATPRMRKYIPVNPRRLWL